jgi:hypothetical protein
MCNRGISMPSKPDILAKYALDSRQLTVDFATGAIYRPDGTRAEILDKASGYGRIRVYKRPLVFAMAHRAIWIAAYGLIPPRLQINHINRRRWDNRLSNLELVTASGNVRHALGHDYDAVSENANVEPGWLESLEARQREWQPNPYEMSAEQFALINSATKEQNHQASPPPP